MNNEGVKNLCNAVIKKAVEDYRAGIDRGHLEIFFRSEWFMLLSRGCVSGETVLKHLKEECKNA